MDESLFERDVLARDIFVRHVSPTDVNEEVLTMIERSFHTADLFLAARTRLQNKGGPRPAAGVKPTAKDPVQRIGSGQSQGLPPVTHNMPVPKGEAGK